MNKNYNGKSEACMDCKGFYRDTTYDRAPCGVCLYRIKEAAELRKSKDGE